MPADRELARVLIARGCSASRAYRLVDRTGLTISLPGLSVRSLPYWRQGFFILIGGARDARYRAPTLIRRFFRQNPLRHHGKVSGTEKFNVLSLVGTDNDSPT
jgi:hypothetical protein